MSQLIPWQTIPTAYPKDKNKLEDLSSRLKIEGATEWQPLDQ